MSPPRPLAPPDDARQEAARSLSLHLRGASRLVIEAIGGAVDTVEFMHRNISGLAPIVGPSRQGPTRGITGLVYRSVRGISRAAGVGIDVGLARFTPRLDYQGVSAKRERALATLNGVLGDYLVATGNPLAIPMAFRKDGYPLKLCRESLASTFPEPSSRLLVMVHGLCMNDLMWQRGHHNHGDQLALSLGYTPLYLHYNSGRHVSTNGREFADRLEQLVLAWPVPVDELVIIGHSMGGLLSRSACHYGRAAGHSWPGRLSKLVFLGTPHHGSPLERVGNRVDTLAGVSPYVAPIGRLGKIRSAGVKDLRHGNILDEDWQAVEPDHPHDARTPVTLPEGTECFAIAATTQTGPHDTGTHVGGDGLVPVMSALGLHADAQRALPIPAAHQCVFYGVNHFDLLDSPLVYERIYGWLTQTTKNG